MSTATYPHRWWAIAGSVLLAALCGAIAAVLLTALHLPVPAIVGGAAITFATSGNFWLSCAKAGGLVH